MSALGSYSRIVKLYQNSYNGSYYGIALPVNFPRVVQAKGWIAPERIIHNYVIDCCRVRGVLKENNSHLRPFLLLLLPQNVKSQIIKYCSLESFEKIKKLNGFQIRTLNYCRKFYPNQKDRLQLALPCLLSHTSVIHIMLSSSTFAVTAVIVFRKQKHLASVLVNHGCFNRFCCMSCKV